MAWREIGCKPAALLPVQGLFLVALAIVTAAEGSPVKILIASDCVIGRLFTSGDNGCDDPGPRRRLVRAEAHRHHRYHKQWSDTRGAADRAAGLLDLDVGERFARISSRKSYLINVWYENSAGN